MKLSVITNDKNFIHSIELFDIKYESKKYNIAIIISLKNLNHFLWL